ncbi:hypothetical protein [Halomonas rhizosphaerae]|uniref:Uncharacterized protein n=1 Tax=Halomonas rhizosphaerae TaxID=3043296 RepID=A0ABT6V0T4_9GAMM|nr:hypothetical protein [Halomonas rhizosphaerae]MDI5891838.1 hypothetical protein [Halomonas rhizosphaerae]
MFHSLKNMAGLTVTALLALPTNGVAEVAEIEHVRLQEPCNGKSGLAIVSYSWFEASTTPETEHIFSDLCLDLDAMKVFSVENSDELRPAYQAPGQMIYHSNPPGYPDRYQEVVTLSNDILFHHDDEGMEEVENLPRPEAPGVLSTFTWVKGAEARPLDRIGLATAWLRGYVGGEPLQNKRQAGRYSGSVADNMLGTKQTDSELSGLGFYMGSEVVVTGDSAEVHLRSPAQVAAVRDATATMRLVFEGDEITGTGTFQAENGLLSPTTERVWKRFNLETADVTGKLTGEDGDHMYVLVIWKGTYTDFAGDSYPVDSVMTFNAMRKE